MHKNKLLMATALCLLPYNVMAETVLGVGEYIYPETMSKYEACKRAENVAKQNAIQKVLGEYISGDVTTNCLDIGDNASCELNSTTWSLMEGHIAEIKKFTKTDFKQTEDTRRCTVRIKAVVNNTPDTPPMWDVQAATNKKNYVDGDKMHINLELTDENIYVYIYQWLPYEHMDNNVVMMYPLIGNTGIKVSEGKMKNGHWQIPNGNASYNITFNKELHGKKTVEDAYIMVLATKEAIPMMEELTMESFTKKLYKIGRPNYQLTKIQYNILEK